MALATEECGCKIVDSVIKAGDLFIVFCPMHAEAKNMAEALDKAIVQLGYCRITHEYCEECTCGHCSVQRDCRQVAAAARGGAA